MAKARATVEQTEAQSRKYRANLAQLEEQLADAVAEMEGRVEKKRDVPAPDPERKRTLQNKVGDSAQRGSLEQDTMVGGNSVALEIWNGHASSHEKRRYRIRTSVQEPYIKGRLFQMMALSKSYCIKKHS